jgi:hypothetical protein
MNEHRIGLRDAGVRRLRRLTATSAAGAGVLALVFAGLAAKAFPGRGSHTTARTVTRSARVPASRRPSQSPPPLVSIGSSGQSASPPAPAPSAPAPTSAAPTVVSGGS